MRCETDGWMRSRPTCGAPRATATSPRRRTSARRSSPRSRRSWPARIGSGNLGRRPPGGSGQRRRARPRCSAVPTIARAGRPPAAPAWSPSPSAPAQLDALHAAVLDVHAGLDGDSTAALAIDRMGLMAVHERVTDPWARCGPRGDAPTTVLDGAYEVTVSEADAARAGWPPGNAGSFGLEVGHGRYAIFHSGRRTRNGRTGTSRAIPSRWAPCWCTATRRCSGPKRRSASARGRRPTASNSSATACGGAT